MFICNAQYDPGKYFYKRRIDGLNLNVPYEVSFWLKDIIRMYHVNDIFNEYRIKKKLFPRKSYYTV